MADANMLNTADMSTTDARARRAERQAVAQALQGTALDWSAIDASPAWVALPAAERDALCAHAGAWWLAASLRGCIDGKRLTRVHDLLGEARLSALRDAPAIARAEALGQAPTPLLPAAHDVPRHLVACGRALLGWRLPAAVRGPVLRQLGWPTDADPGHHAAFAAHPDWARQALQIALGHEPPPAQAANTVTLSLKLEQADALADPGHAPLQPAAE